MAKIVAANDLAIKAAVCEAGKKATEYRIAGVDRLILRVEASGSGSYWLRYSAGGSDKRLRIGKRGVNSWKEVRAKAAEINATIEAGSDPHEIKQVAAGKITLGELWEAWKEARAKDVSPKTTAYYELALKTFVWPEIAREELAGSITAIRVAALVRKVALKSKSRAKAARDALGTMYSFGYPDLVSNNPTKGIVSLRKSTERNDRDRVPTAEEVGLVWNALSEGKGLEPRTLLALKLLILTGQRNSMAAGARHDELKTLSTANPSWIIGKERMKKAREQTVPLTKLTTALFREALDNAANDKELFAYDHHTISRAMNRMMTRLGIEDLTVHDFRRGLNTWCAENGVSFDVRSRIMAHELQDVNSRVYNKSAMLEPMREALQRWEAYVLQCAEGTKASGSGNVLQLKRAG